MPSNYLNYLTGFTACLLLFTLRFTRLGIIETWMGIFLRQMLQKSDYLFDNTLNQSHLILSPNTVSGFTMFSIEDKAVI